MDPGQARGQRRRIVGDEQVARCQEVGEPLARGVMQAAARVDDEQPGVIGPLQRRGGGLHAGTSSFAR